MTGGGGGFCVLRLQSRRDEPLIGASGRAGWPVGRIADGEDELAHLRSQAEQIETILRAIRGRIKHLQAVRWQEPIGV
jgi:hypothetical protein